MSPQIWNKIFLVLTILGRCILIEQLSTRKNCRYIYISGRQVCNLGTLSAMIVTRWRRWRSGWRRRLFWCRLFASDLRRCTHSFAPLACAWIFRCAILARKAADSLIFINHCRVSFYLSFHLSMPRKFNTPVHLISDFCARILDQVLRFLYRGMRKPSCVHFRHNQGKAHVCLF